jgi:hypothetical protein
LDARQQACIEVELGKFHLFLCYSEVKRMLGDERRLPKLKQ